MARPYWSGQVQISLVQFGVSLYTATESKAQISFHQISRSTGERIRHQKVLQSSVESDDASPAVGKDDIVKGYEYSKGQYVTIEPSELENLRVPSKHTIAVSQFIDLKELNPEYVEKPYYVTPENDAQAEAFAVVREALEKTGKAAVGKVAFSGREHIVAIAPAGPGSRGMMAYLLRYSSELRCAAEYFRDIKETVINEDALEMAEALIAKKTAKFDPTRFEDGYEKAVKELVEAKIKNQPVPQEEPARPQPAKVVSLMDALRKSIGSEGTAAAPARAGKKPPASEKEPAAKGIGLVKPAKAAAKRKTA